MRSASRTASSRRQRQRLVLAVGVQRLRAAQHRRQRLQAVRTTLLSGCWAVSVEPAVCVWKRSSSERASFAPKRSRMILRPHAPRRAELGDLLEEVVVGVEEERELPGEVVHVQPGVERGPHVGDAVGEREADLLRGGAAGLADVVAGDRDGVPARRPRRRSSGRGR